MKKTLLMMALAIATVSVSAKSDNKVDTLQVATTPQMHCANCEKKIKTNIRFVKGVKSIETSVPEQKVKIVYDPTKSTYQDFEAAFKKIGYEITPTQNARKD